MVWRFEWQFEFALEMNEKSSIEDVPRILTSLLRCGRMIFKIQFHQISN